MGKQNIKKALLISIFVQMLILISITNAAAVPKIPMFLHGEVINTDTSWKAPEGTVVIVKTDNGQEFQDTVDSSGKYGEPASDRLVVQECGSFEIFVKIGDSEISMGTQKWQSGAVEELELRYSLKDMQGEIVRKTTPPTTYPSRGRTVTPATETPVETQASEESSSITEGTKAGTGEVQSAGVEATSTPSPSATQEQVQEQNAVKSSWWQQPTVSILIVAIVIGIIATITYISRK